MKHTDRDEFSRYVQRITWKYKLAENTIRIKKWKDVEEIQIFEVILKEKVMPKKVFSIIDKIIPYPILYECKCNDHVAYLMSYNKEYYNTDRDEDIEFNLTWSNFDRIYENIISKFITDDPIESTEAFHDLINWKMKIELLKKDIDKLKIKIRKELQFKDQLKLNVELQNKEKELEILLSQKNYK